MPGTRPAALAFALLLAACSGEATDPADAAASDGGAEQADAAPMTPDAGPAWRDAAQPGDDAGAGPADSGPQADGGPPGCLSPGPGCTCVDEPAEPARACWHTFGGRYSSGACSEGFQCCGGAWQAVGVCGACTCVEATGEVGCVPAPEAVAACFPSFEGSAEALSDALRQSMTGVSWKPGCPLGLDELSLLTTTHWGFDGAVHQGAMVVASSAAADLLEAFRRIYEARFPIERMKLVDDYGASDDASMADNNSSAFNCRAITGGSSYSQHSYGTAIDLNPVQNPYVWGSTVLPPEGAAYVDRTDGRQGMILDPGPVTGAFRAIGWYWGGAWTAPLDYQHFSINDR